MAYNRDSGLKVQKNDNATFESRILHRTNAALGGRGRVQ